MASARATRGRWGASLALASLCLAAVLAVAQAFKTIDEVPYAEKDEATGKTVVVTMTGKKWELVLSKEHSRVYFLELDVPEGKEQRAIWEDPRTEPLTDEELASLPAQARDAYEASAKGRHLSSADLQAKGGAVSTVVLVSVVPLLLFTAGLVARIWYLQTYHPGLLFPTKERKERVRSNSKFKPTKARGKMSQDGKGGRSANS